MSAQRYARITFTVLVVAGSVTLAGCVSNSDGSAGVTTSSPAAPGRSDLNALLPAKIKKAGVLVAGVTVPYSPNEYLDSSGKVVGFDVDLLDATAQVLGLKVQYRQADFDKIIPAVTAGTYDLGMSSFTDNKVRESAVDFVDYFSAGYLWAAQAGKTVDPDNACGLTVSVQTNSVEQLDQLPQLSKACTQAGRPAIKVLSYDSQDDATNAVVLGKANAMSADSPVTAYAIKQTGGKLQQAGQITEAAPYGWPVVKGSGLVQAMRQALQALMDAGTYQRICEKWGLRSGELKTAAVNGATN